MDKLRAVNGLFLKLQLVNTQQVVQSENIYWLPDSTGNYSGLQKMKQANVVVTAHRASRNTIEVKIKNPMGNPMAFFNRISLVNPETGKRILPVFYDNNYVSVVAGAERTVTLSYDGDLKGKVTICGWNVNLQTIDIQ